MKKWCFFFFLLLSGSIFCQNTLPINTDRPDQSDGVFTLSPGTFQLETGLTYGKSVDDYLLHNTMFRLGLLSSTEIRVAIDYGKQSGDTGLMPIGISIKQGLIENRGALPAMTIIGSINLPFLASNVFEPNKIPVGLTLAFENGLSDTFSLSYNLGVFTDGASDEPNWLATANLGYAPLEKIAFFLEYFATYTKIAPPDHNVDAGVAWLLKNNLQLDLAFGTSIFRDAAQNQFVTAGFSYRFD